MSSDPLPSLLVTPDLRRRLQQRYEEAQRLAMLPGPDFRRVHELLAECVRADPGNTLYLDALLANLRRRGAAQGRPWWARWLAPRLRSAGSMQVRRKDAKPDDDTRAGPANRAHSTQYTVLSQAADWLWREPNDVAALQQLAQAAEACDFDDIELRYLAAARQAAPDDIQTLRMLARALARQGRFEDAIGPWCAVVALAAGDAEAERAIADLRGAEASGDDSPPPAPREMSSDAQSLVSQARALQTAGMFSQAEEHFAHAQAALGGDLELLHEREELRLRRSEERLAIARRRAASDAHPKAQSLVASLESEHNRLEIEILNIRAERQPEDWSLRLELAKRLKRAGNYSGAIQRLEEVLRLQPQEPVGLIELGECWQHLRQFAKALELYQRAIAATGPSNVGDAEQLARYRTGVLAAAMGQTGLAREHLAAIVAAQPGFKDARERLDKLGTN
jgi:tetratricopeptide (TPR) repeat protein